MRPRKAKVYLQIANRSPHTSYWSEQTATVVNATNTPPEKIAKGCIVIPVIIEVPQELWAQHAPAVQVTVPADAPTVDASLDLTTGLRVVPE